MKKFLVCLSTITILIFGLSIQISATVPISVEVNGKLVEFPDAKPFIDANGRTLVPLRPIADAMGMSVEWNDEKRQAAFSRDYDENDSRLYDDERYDFLKHEKITFSIGSKTAVYYEAWAMINKSFLSTDAEDMTDVIVDTREKSSDIIMNTEAIIVDGYTYAPVRYIAEAVGYTVSWDGDSRTVIITDYDHQPSPEPTEAPEPAVTPVFSDKDLNKLGFFSLTYLSVEPDTVSYMDIYYGRNYEGHKVKNIAITSAKMDGDDIDCELMSEWDFRYASYMEPVASFKVGLPEGMSSYKMNRTYSFEFRVIIEYVDGTKIVLNDSKLLYVG